MTFTKGFDTGSQLASEVSFNQNHAEKLAYKFLTQLNKYHATGTQEDDKVLTKYFRDYINILAHPFEVPTDHKDIPKFRPSGVSGCPREWFYKLTNTPADIPVDEKVTPPYQTRWQNIGTLIGDMIQKDLLHMETKGYNQFRFDKITHNLGGEVDYLFPYFEQFSTVSKVIEHGGKTFRLQGSTDGIMVYTDEYGEELQVGLEIKSKQTSYSTTSKSQLKSPNESHVKQVTAYSLMFDVDYWIIIYVNGSKKAWTMDESEIDKSPDIRTFGIYVTEEMKHELKARLAEIVTSVENNNPLPLDLNGWLFNEYKKACAKGLSEEELQAIVDEVESHSPTITRKGKEIINSTRTKLQKILDEILEIRESIESEGVTYVH